VVVAFAVVGVAVGGDAKADLKKFAGTWAVEKALKGGQPPPGDEATNMRFSFAGDKMTLKQGDKNIEGTFKIDAGKKPRHIEVMIEGKTFEGIYKFEKGRLTMCVTEQREARPTKFESPEGSKIILVVLKREKS